MTLKEQAQTGGTKEGCKKEAPQRGYLAEFVHNNHQPFRDWPPIAFMPFSRPIKEVMVVAEAQHLLKNPSKLKNSLEKRLVVVVNELN